MVFYCLKPSIESHSNIIDILNYPVQLTVLWYVDQMLEMSNQTSKKYIEYIQGYFYSAGLTVARDPVIKNKQKRNK